MEKNPETIIIPAELSQARFFMVHVPLLPDFAQGSERSAKMRIAEYETIEDMIGAALKLNPDDVADIAFFKGERLNLVSFSNRACMILNNEMYVAEQIQRETK